MTICDKIRTVGDTLETNLNARGVSCTFGTGTGEKTILDMVNLITSSNLKGSSDAVISISASRPYLLSGEKTDLIVRLVDGLGQPLANKSVSISDGTSSYSGITNIEGKFTLYDITVSEDTTFTATYSSVTDTVLVEYCDFVDYAVTNNKNTDWLNYSSRLNVSNDENGTLLNKGSANGYYLVSISNEQFLFTDYIVEFDVVSCTNQTYWYQQGQTSGTQDTINLANYFTNGGHCKIVCDDGIVKIYKNGNQVGTDITVTPIGNLEVGFHINTHSTDTRNIKYKNFRVHTS